MESRRPLNIGSLIFNLKDVQILNVIYNILNLLKLHVLQKILRLKLHVLQKILKVLNLNSVSYKKKIDILQKPKGT